MLSDSKTPRARPQADRYICYINKELKLLKLQFLTAVFTCH